jgi:Carboxypeptidase regulatory-like domain/Bacterial Ig-like domain
VDSTVPGPLAVVPGFKGPVRIQFDERLSEQGVDGSVSVSPPTSRWRLKRKADALVVSMDSAWRPGTIYRVVVAPTIQDLFHNKIRAPFELVFSTGPRIPETVVAGVVTDRMTDKPLDNARVDAIYEPDSLSYVATTDRQGLFAMRHVPTGHYRIVAYLDQNQNDKLDAFEPRDTMTYDVAADTSLLALRLLPNDTTPANVVRASGEDSLHIRVSLDDALDPDQPLDSVSVGVWHLPDSVQVGVRRVMQLHVFEDEKKAAAQAQAKAAPADTLHRDTAHAAPPKPALPPAPATPGTPGTLPAAPGQPAPVLPSRDFIVELAAPLTPHASYRVTVQGVTNISGLRGGGGSAAFEAPAPRPAAKPGAGRDTTGAARDTSRLHRDTTGVHRDTIGVHRDTTGIHRDTIGVHRDTTGIRRDTTGIRRDTTGAPRGAIMAPDRRRGSRWMRGA